MQQIPLNCSIEYAGVDSTFGDSVRFTESGPSLPDDLLFAQDEGQVVFFCGSGVSLARAGLPNFVGLATKVFDNLGATDESEAKRVFEVARQMEREHNVRGMSPTDQIFGLLERTFDPKDIGRAVGKSLEPTPPTDLSAHKTLLKLARLPGGQTRLITTNFDLLFEACNRRLRSRTRSALPRIEFTDNDWGIVHLHGRVMSDYSGPDRDGFVLSSAEFGDAYLAQGWARDFIRDVLGRHIAVFVGYSAEDPPIRYLLEGLRQTSAHSHNIYAFQAGPDGEAAAQWHEKGVVPIVYDLGPDGHHENLWTTLDAWGSRTTNPAAWRKKIFSMARKGPAKLKSFQRGMVAHIVNSSSGAVAFSRERPALSAEWLCVFDPGVRFQRPERANWNGQEGDVANPYLMYALDDDAPPPGQNEGAAPLRQLPEGMWDAFAPNVRDRLIERDDGLPALRGHWARYFPRLPPRISALGYWIAEVAHQPAAVWWAARQYSLHPEIIDAIRHRLPTLRKGANVEAVRSAWAAIVEYHQLLDDDDLTRFELRAEIAACGWSPFIVRQYLRVNGPALKLGSVLRRPIPPSTGKRLSQRDFLWLTVEYPDGFSEIQVPDKYLQQIVSGMRANLERAVDLEIAYSYSVDFCSISPGDYPDSDAYSRTHELSGYVLNFTQLIERLVVYDAKAAKAEYKAWRQNDPVFSRLRVWAGGLAAVVSGEEFADQILGLSTEQFWPFRGERDFLIALAQRWNQIPEEQRTAIEKRILAGPEKYNGEGKRPHAERAAFRQLNRFHWLAAQGCEFSFNLDQKSSELRKKAPAWKQSYAEHAADSRDGRGGWVKTDTSWDSLAKLPINEIIENAKRERRHDYEALTQYDPFAGLSQEAPLKALSALAFEGRRGVFHADLWETFLRRSGRKGDSLRLKVLTAGRLLQMPNDEFSKILRESSHWFEDIGASLRTERRRLFDDVWEKFITTITAFTGAAGSALVRKHGDADADIDWATEAINSPAGNLAELTMTDPANNGLELGQGFPAAWLVYVEQLLSLPGDSRRFAIAIFAFNLGWFHAIDPNWTERALLSVLDSDEAEELDKDALWAGFMWGAKIPRADLYARLKPNLLRMASERRVKRRRHQEVLSGILLSGWGSKKNGEGERYISSGELRGVLLDGDYEFVANVLWHMKRWSQDATLGWREQLVEFLQSVWPKQKRLKTPKISASLCNLALSQADNFPEVAREVSHLVSRIEGEHPFISELHRMEEEHSKKHPRELLDLLYAILPTNPALWPHGASAALKDMESAAPVLLRDPKFIELKGRMNEP